MAYITFVPSDSLIIIDSEVATPINFAGIDPLIHAIQWYGTSGWVEFVGDPVANTKPPNELIESLTPYQTYIDQATDIIYWKNNPEVYYCTTAGTIYGGNTYILGQSLTIDTPNQIPPTTGFTQIQPPTVVDNYAKLYWYSNNWLVSSVDPTLSLVNAQAYLIQELSINSAFQANNEARAYSFVQLFDSADVNLLSTADYSPVTLGDYQTFLDGQVATKTATINSATTVPELYDFDPTISGVYV
jgi:hypothetical protein